MSVVRLWMVHPVVGGRRWGWGALLVFECCKMLGGIYCVWG